VGQSDQVAPEEDGLQRVTSLKQLSMAGSIAMMGEDISYCPSHAFVCLPVRSGTDHPSWIELLYLLTDITTVVGVDKYSTLMRQSTRVESATITETLFGGDHWLIWSVLSTVGLQFIIP
jgi:hypothetical protein